MVTVGLAVVRLAEMDWVYQREDFFGIGTEADAMDERAELDWWNRLTRAEGLAFAAEWGTLFAESLALWHDQTQELREAFLTSIREKANA